MEYYQIKATGKYGEVRGGGGGSGEVEKRKLYGTYVPVSFVPKQDTQTSFDRSESNCSFHQQVTQRFGDTYSRDDPMRLTGR